MPAAWNPTEQDRRRAVAMVANGATMALIARELGTTKPTLFKHMRADLDHGLELREGLVRSEIAKVWQQNDNLHAKMSAAKWEMATTYGVVEKTALDVKRTDDSDEARQAEKQTALDQANAKIEEIVGHALKVDMNFMAAHIRKAIETGNYTGDPTPFAHLAAPGQVSVVSDDSDAGYEAKVISPEAIERDSEHPGEPEDTDAEPEFDNEAALAEGRRMLGI